MASRKPRRCSEQLASHSRSRYRAPVITRYLDRALRRARYREVDDGTFCATVRGLPGVIATGASLEACRDQLAEIIEEWVLVRSRAACAFPRSTARPSK